MGGHSEVASLGTGKGGAWLSRDLHEKETEIADLIAALWAASQPLLSAGMRGQMHDIPARAFAAYLYSGLAFGNSVKRAFHQACAAIGDEPDSTRPRLFFRHGVDPHKVVLVRPEGGGVP